MMIMMREMCFLKRTHFFQCYTLMPLLVSYFMSEF